ncbi:uncharacterized protein LOC133917468 [Phragmites australis]|uniref:uncharacterized protein LOC133917468 n=1 Tax=Phragmites australis TaxID=29695 RepID=UPI002D778E45|nr:uncharacterized protein LOC133917468 [Phragmites australis]
MSAKAAEILGLPCGVKFHPDDEELVEFYLLPRVRGQPVLFPGVIVEDDTAASTLPWKLFERHHLADDEEAYFYVRTSDAKEGARQDRSCNGGGTWKGQKRIPCILCVGGEKIEWSKYNLSLHMGGGSTGWVMHEYTVTAPSCPFFKICHVSFTGHGQKRKRVPDDHDDCQGESASQRARVNTATADSGSATSVPESTTTTVDQDSGAAHAADQEPAQCVLTDEEIKEIVDYVCSDDLPDFPSAASADAEPCFEEHVQAAAPTTEQQVDHVIMLLPMVQEEHLYVGDQDQQDFRGLPCGVKFHPDDEELVEFYLLPRVRGQPVLFPGVIIEDDTAASMLPWKLFERHHLADDEEAYFNVRISDAKEGARPDRSCDGGGTWKGQKRIPYILCVGGEKIEWSKYNLSLHMGGGSTGWVMHEYTVTAPPCPFFKICHVSFTGHGQKHKRVPDDHDDCQGGSASQRACVNASTTDSGSATSVPESTMTTVDQDSGAAHAADQEPAQRVLTDEEIKEIVDYVCSNDLPDFPSAASADAEPCFEEHVQAAAPTIEQQVEDQQDFLASMGGSFCDVPDIGDMAAGTQLGGVDWGGFHFY